ncbi:MAG: hypothetical protein N4A33_09250 [Bacteriovoracaceae bacterium]|jgi:peptidyl-prolyl cis-trans isomerase SurA|nr:hypothetical protein [Bacteriovoracaceae bacterium]
MKKISCILLLLTFSIQAKLLDKVAGVINDKVYTLSDLKEIQSSIKSRKEIAGFVYSKNKYSVKDIFFHLRNSYIIRDKLSEQGIVISDERVEEQIVATKKRLNINQSILEQSLRDRGLSYEQYFELTREITEFNIFNRNIIAPLVNITDQEIKNLFYKESKNKNTFSFNYYLIDYVIDKKKLSKKDVKNLPKILSKYKINGILPGKIKSLVKNDLGNISDEDLPADIRKVLRSSSQDSFSKPITKGNDVHIFFLKKKELAESEEFKAAKNQIYARLFAKRSKNITNTWFNREALNYYILKNI